MHSIADHQFFFDVHPPLARLIVALTGWLAKLNPEFEFESIGDSYIENRVPYVYMRSLLAAIGALLVPLVFRILRVSGSPVVTSLMGACLVLFDNSLQAQARLIMLDSPMLLFILLSLYSYICFYRERYNDFSWTWWTWLLATGVFLGATISCKMVGVFSFATVGAAVVLDLWRLLDLRAGLSMRQVTRHFVARALALIVVPAILYLSTFYVHFALLPKTGAGDAFMSADFRQSLEGSDLLQSSVELHAFDKITLRHRPTLAYLHSQMDKYPMKYDDGRISSQGQQVTAVHDVDELSWWQIVPVSPVDDDNGTFNITRRKIFHNQRIRLLHVATQSYLMTHDVAAPLMPTNEEFTTVPKDELGTQKDNTLFELSINGETAGSHETWSSRRTWLRLIHVPTRVSLWTHNEPLLPEWGFEQQEVNGNKNVLDKTALWYVEDVEVDPDSPMYEVRSKPVPARERRAMSFWRKFTELQVVMLEQNNALTSKHPYASRPISWPFLLQGVSYWDKDGENKQIYLIGNVFTWWVCIASISIYSGIMLMDLLLRRRGIYQIPSAVRNRMLNTTGFFVWAWACHYFPFFVMGRQLFLHHYLPASICSVLVFAGIFDFLAGDAINFPLSRPGPALSEDRIRSRLRLRVTRTVVLKAAFVVACAVAMFLFLLPFSIGSGFASADDVLRHRVLSSWSLHYVK